MSYEIRTASLEEMRKIHIKWCADLQWNPGLNDCASFISEDAQGVFLGCLDGEPIATVTGIRFGKDLGFVGVYICKQEHRGKGYGVQLFNHAMKWLEGRNIGLDGVLEQVPNYKKSGFKEVWTSARYECVGKPILVPPSNLVNLKDFNFDAIVDFDAIHFSERRPNFLKTWIGSPGITALGLVDKEGKLTAMGVMRPAYTGFRIGPFFSTTPSDASILLDQLLAFTGGSKAYLDIPDINQNAVQLMESRSFPCVFQCKRMYIREMPNIPINQVYGVTALELG